MLLSGVDTAAILMVFQSAVTRSSNRSRLMQRLGGWEFPTRQFFRLGVLVLVLDAALQVVPLHFLHQLGHLMYQFWNLATHHH